ncbi:hypothetical protein EUGRSUZ_C01574 [Eucalyptus grandis]|uniref:Uncharacterized protein n=2 Tax=Eucalyptus grandis TaxID=71139 RepID=A0ACC3LDW1_EUCGR|nr:hypothetical protein EUGRSUZ_C01574 [Eucalyptus grandis]
MSSTSSPFANTFNHVNMAADMVLSKIFYKEKQIAKREKEIMQEGRRREKGRDCSCCQAGIAISTINTSNAS